MKQRVSFQLNRRKWLLASAATLAGCGGGGSNLSSALPGTGGTGIGVQGTITGFGSVIVNGKKFDDHAANIYMDGVASSSTELRIGMVANISGSLDAGSAAGTASRIDVWSIASGLPLSVDVNGSSFQLAGMTFSTDVSTTYEGVASLSAITSSTPVTVWGVQTSANGSNRLATRIKVLASTPASIVSTGLLNTNASGNSLNGMPLNGISLSGFSNGQLVRVTGAFDNSGNLTVSSAIAFGTEKLIPLSGNVEIEGAVTSVVDASHFSIGSIAVNASGISLSGMTQSISVGTFLEVSGLINGATLTAVELSVHGTNAAIQVDITGNVDTFNSVSDFTVRGQKCDASNAIVQSGSLDSLRSGTKVHLTGPSEGDEVLRVQYLSVGVP